ncbi:hypothetical protein DY000_02063186 [Brassica cretica]|uniref:THO1-MOS11 C-terminal domain-containing protein n=1 Tax=Brassica cretica TaxID=69181 RepID=A0ABQ7ATK8_BRACR|nr:hypothetical protein DY000_02063186 [Brassica cretica]
MCLSLSPSIHHGEQLSQGHGYSGEWDVSPVDDVQKKIRRAERFGVSVKLTEEEKRNSRAERYD